MIIVSLSIIMRHFCNAKKYLNDKLEVQESFWKKKSNIKWLKKVDNNTKFFHQSVKIRRQKLYLSRIRGSNGLWLTDQEDIAKEAIHAYMTQLNGDL